MRKRARNADPGRLIDAAPIVVPEPPSYDDIRALARAVHIPHSASTPTTYRDGWADGYAAAVSDARSSSGDRDTDPGTDRAEVGAFTDTAAHNIALAHCIARARTDDTYADLAYRYAGAYDVAVDRLRSLAAGRGRSGPDRSRGRDGGAS